MSDKPKQKRSFKFIIRFFQIVAALIFVFWASFFITLAIRSSHPIEYLFSYVEDFFGDEDKDKKNSTPATEMRLTNNRSPAIDEKKYDDYKPTVTEERRYREDKTLSDSRSSAIPMNNVEVGVFGRVERLWSIENAVDERVRRIPHYVSLDNIPRSLQQAVIAVEDARFYSHSGFDVMGIARAAVVNVEAGEIEEGASTITQQLVKNLFLTSEPSFTRKAEELLLAMNVERHFSKNKIIELYLNTIYFGSNYYGIYDASQGYFGKEPKDLTVAESAMLAGLPNAPSLYSPYVDFMLAKKRQLVVINAMANAHLLSEREAENARIEEIVLAKTS